MERLYMCVFKKLEIQKKVQLAVYIKRMINKLVGSLHTIWTYPSKRWHAIKKTPVRSGIQFGLFWHAIRIEPPRARRSLTNRVI